MGPSVLPEMTGAFTPRVDDAGSGDAHAQALGAARQDRLARG